MDSLRAALALLAIASAHAGAMLTGFELMSALCMTLVTRHFPQLRYPFVRPYPQLVLLELSDSESEDHARQIFETMMQAALEAGVVQTPPWPNRCSSRATSGTCASTFRWPVEEGRTSHDIAVPISRIADFIEATDALLQQASRRAHGHVRPSRRRQPALQRLAARRHRPRRLPRQPCSGQPDRARQRAYGAPRLDLGGARLASSREENQRYKSEVELLAMRAIKQALDPLGLMNPQVL